jgi:hypothetical protein
MVLRCGGSVDAGPFAGSAGSRTVWVDDVASSAVPTVPNRGEHAVPAGEFGPVG